MSETDSSELLRLREENELLRQQVSSLQSEQRNSFTYPHQHEFKMSQRINEAQVSSVDGSPGTKKEISATCGEERQKVVVCVPATSANMGPGFDTIGNL